MKVPVEPVHAIDHGGWHQEHHSKNHRYNPPELSERSARRKGHAADGDVGEVEVSDQFGAEALSRWFAISFWNVAWYLWSVSSMVRRMWLLITAYGGLSRALGPDIIVGLGMESPSLGRGNAKLE